MAARGTARGAAESGPGPVGGTREEAEGDDDGEAMDVDEEDEVRPVFGQTQTALASERAALEMRDYFASSFAQQQAMQGGMGANQMQMQGQYRQDGLLAQPSHGGRAGDTLAAAEREKHVAMQSRAAATLFRRDDASALRRTAQPRLDEDDDYMECYPAFAPGVSNEAYDSDEEDRTQMDMGRLKPVGAKSRHDFQSKEDWEKYQLNKEALPKAAFQFGKKSAELQGGKKKGGKLNEEQQWKKIQKMHSEGKTKSMDQVG
uniref:Protein RED C-terminal domain-containing protein n=1 Tax=Chromera velia CCMP2878 TaxID=1169474 RepID=A0A0G4FXD1_9ALVE|eukprot:Cvel_19252.t1-p1 / transcript=Cvel_19252.t1 / gene=Cvel_19252 / organism=Chromera_velia_CCMP2878 / gene_product=Protein Red, putative / transcript_product=Protein Red, putative / location=Cvel_scaffold1647:37111-41104(-) / protein_length=259 / sequence_SO=supercontig / SO=protein_coding / is_pseudo=false